MAELKTTPGPWIITERKGHACFGKDSIECLVHAGSSDPRTGHGNAFASVSLGGSGAISARPEDVRANARLIAAAPELYDAADELLGALADIYSHLQKTTPERLVLPVREAANKLAYAMRKVEEADRG